jgi:spore coat protein CotF
MPGMTHKELQYLEDCLKAEQLAVHKCNFFSSESQDPEIQEVCMNMANKHQQHYNTLLRHLQSSSGVQ